MEPIDQTPNLRKAGQSPITTTMGSRLDADAPTKARYSPPKLRKIPHEELAPVWQNAFYSVKYIYINDVFAKYRAAFLEDALKGATFHKYRLLFDDLPRTLEKCDVVIVGGNDLQRLAGFIKVNLPLVQHVPVIAITGDLGPKSRSKLMNLGYDDVMNLKGLSAEEMAAKIAAIFNRYKMVEEKSDNLRIYRSSLNEICEVDRLTRSERLTIEALFDAKGNICRYGWLRAHISRDYDSISLMHVRVIIHSLREKMKEGYTIENIRGIGYRLSFIREKTIDQYE